MRDGDICRRHGKPRGIGILARADGVEPTLGNVAARGKLVLELRKHLIRRRALPIKKLGVIRHTVLQSCMGFTLPHMIAKPDRQG